MDEKLLTEFLLDWTECNKVCDLGSPKREKHEGMSKVDYYMQILPGADYVRSLTMNYIYSNGITTGSINQDEILDDFLYRVNEVGITNYDVLKNANATAISHGCCGVRWYKNNIYRYEPETYQALPLRNDDGIEIVAGYLISTDGEKVHKFDTDELKNVQEYRELESWLKERKLILLDTKEFLNLRNDTSLEYGYSPLLRDELRLDLLVAVYERLNYDILYDGPGRIVIRPKDGYINGENNEVSTSMLMNQSVESNKKRVDAIKKEAERVGNEIKNSSSDSVIVLSNAFEEKITHLERVTKATEFFNWIKNEGVILAQDFGMPPSLLELGGISGNVSMTSIIDNAMVNSIVPIREKYAMQFSPFLAKNLGVDKAYFNLYEMQQAENENTMRTQIVNIMSLLNSMNDDQGNTRAEALQLFRDFGEMLSDNIHNENEQLEEL